MWTVHSKAQEQGLRITKGTEVERDTRYWLRPGGVYRASRSEETEFYLTHKRHSRKDAAFTIHASQADPNKVQVSGPQATIVPPYTLELVAGAKAVFVIQAGKQDIEVQAGGHITIQDGMIIKTLPDHDSLLYFQYCPVSVFHRSARRKNLPELVEQAAKLGVTFSAAVSSSGGDVTHTLPNKSHTHYLTNKLQKDVTPPQLMAAACNLTIVNALWLDALLQSGTPSANANSAGVLRSKLEEDFEGNWPDEKDFFPPVDDRAATAAERALYSANNARSIVFEGCIFIDHSSDPNLPLLIENSGGLVCQPSLADVDAFERDVRAFKQQHRTKATGLSYALGPLLPDGLSAQERKVLEDGAEIVSVKTFVSWAEITNAIMHGMPLGDVGRPPASQRNTASQVPGPTPSAPAATADISFPATNPNDAPLAAGQRPFLARQAATEDVAVSDLTTKPSKKPRKLGARPAVDPLADMFNDDMIQTQLVSHPPRIPSRDGSTMEVDNAGSSMASTTSRTGNAASTTIPRANSKYAGLKRRAGTENSQLTPLHELGQDEADFEVVQPPVKKHKSFDPDVESAMSQAAAKRKQKMKEQESLAGIVEDAEVEEVVVPAVAKRKAAAAVGVSDDEQPRPTQRSRTEQTQQPRAQATAKSAANAAKSEVDSATQVAQTQSKESKYLQIKTGRKRVTKDEAAFNEDFNRLKIVKPLRPEARKMGWNERDIVEEELQEDSEDGGRWEPDDNATFFQIRFVSMVGQRPKRAAGPVDPRYAGMPNFKAFRPKDGRNGAVSIGARRKERPAINLTIQAPLGFGLKESYGREASRETDSEDDIEMPMANSKRKAVPKKSATQNKGKQPAQPTKSRRRNVVSESEEEEDELDELDEESRPQSSTARGGSEPAGRRTARMAEAITLDSDSSDDNGKRFTGFQKQPSKRRR